MELLLPVVILSVGLILDSTLLLVWQLRVNRRLAALEAELWPPTCRVCGCTDDEACWPNGCHWVEPDLCSACVPGNPTGQGV